MPVFNIKVAASLIIPAVSGTCVAALLFSFYRQTSSRAFMANNVKTLTVQSAEIVRPELGYLGNPSSPFTLVEFMDYECPPCRASFQQVKEAVLKSYYGRIKLQVRHFPLQIHPHARAAAIFALEASGQRDFQLIHERLMTYAKPLDSNGLSALASELHLDKTQLAREKSRALNTLARDILVARQIGVTGTPSFVLCAPGGKARLFVGITPLEELMSHL